MTSTSDNPGDRPSADAMSALASARHHRTRRELDKAAGLYREAMALAPGLLDPCRELAEVLLDLGRPGEAVQLAPLLKRHGSPAALVTLAEALNRSGRPAEALEAAEEALRLKASDPAASHQKAAALSALGRPRDAHATLVPFGPQAPLAIRFERGRAALRLGRAGEALADLEAVSRALPEDRSIAEAHVQAAAMAGAADRVAEMFSEGSDAGRLSAGTLLFRAVTLRRLGAQDAALALIGAAEGRFGRHRAFDAVASDILLDRGDVGNALARAERAHQGGGPDDDTALPLARALLATGDPGRARALAQAALGRDPLDQLWLAHRITASAMLGQEDPALAPGLDAVTQVVDLDLPLDDLAGTLRALHRSRAQPVDQSLRGGTQTTEPLHELADPAIRALFAAIGRGIDRFIARMPDIPDHPLASRRTRRWRFTGSWSVRLRRQGHHVSHIHPGGWISAAAYIDVAGAVSRTGYEGWLALGAPPPVLRTGLAPITHVEPKPGRLVLFPSYLWHGTVPFSSDAERLTVAFDVVPA